MSSEPRLSPADRDVVTRAASTVTRLCDQLRPELLARAGAIGSTAKDDGTPVTEADLDADRRIHEHLTSAFPDHAVVSEEGDTTWHGHHWTWVVDPIDGTSNFSAGIPYWSVAIALLRNGRPVYGCVEAPPIGARFEAVLGEGATRNGHPIHVAEPVDFRSGRFSHVPLILTAGSLRRSRGTVRLNARVMGSAALDLALVASGAAVATYQRVPKVWDMAAGALLVTEAGGCHLSMSDPILPPTVGAEMATRTSGSFAGPDQAWLRDLADAL